MSFIAFASRNFSDHDIALLPEVIAEDSSLHNVLAIIQEIGSTLVAVFKLHENEQLVSIPGLKNSNSQPKSLMQNPLAQEIQSNAPHSSTLSPAIQEFIRFIEVSAGPSRIDQRPDEEAYQDKVEKDPEVYLCFRDRNDTYKRALSMLDAEHSKDDPLFLARWMMFRLYAWGVYAVQNLLEERFSCAEDVFNERAEVSRKYGPKATVVTA